jgi:hypothetical protein
MCYWLMPESGIVVANTSVQHIIQDDHNNPSIQQKIDRFDASLAERLSDANFMMDPSKTINPLDIFNNDDNLPLNEEESNLTQDIDNLK